MPRRPIRWRWRLVALLGVVALGRHALADPPPKDFWRILTKPNARWVLHDTYKEKGRPTRTVVVETYDVRKLGSAEVARLRWTQVWGNGKGKDDKSDLGNSDGGMYTQVAVTSAGLYILDAGMDDAKIVEALTHKPSRSEPPKEYKGTKTNSGRYLRFEEKGKEVLVCYGYEPGPDAPACDDTCFGELCISPTRGVVEITGTWAPDMGVFAQKGYE